MRDYVEKKKKQRNSISKNINDFPKVKKLWEMVKDREAWRAAVHEVAESDTTEQLNNKRLKRNEVLKKYLRFQLGEIFPPSWLPFIYFLKSRIFFHCSPRITAHSGLYTFVPGLNLSFSSLLMFNLNLLLPLPKMKKDKIMKRPGTNEKRRHITRNLDYSTWKAVLLQNVCGELWREVFKKLAKVK